MPDGDKKYCKTIPGQPDQPEVLDDSDNPSLYRIFSDLFKISLEVVGFDARQVYGNKDRMLSVFESAGIVCPLMPAKEDSFTRFAHGLHATIEIQVQDKKFLLVSVLQDSHQAYRTLDALANIFFRAKPNFRGDRELDADVKIMVPDDKPVGYAMSFAIAGRDVPAHLQIQNDASTSVFGKMGPSLPWKFMFLIEVLVGHEELHRLAR